MPFSALVIAAVVVGALWRARPDRLVTARLQGEVTVGVAGFAVRDDEVPVLDGMEFAEGVSAQIAELEPESIAASGLRFDVGVVAGGGPVDQYQVGDPELERWAGEVARQSHSEILLTGIVDVEATTTTITPLLQKLP